MSSILAKTCWPNRFWLKWFLVFFFTAVVGAVLAAFTRPKSQPPVAPPTIQALIEVRDATGKLVAARVYLAKSKEEMDDGKSFPVSRTTPAAKSQNAGLIYDFMIQPLDEKGNRVGEPEHKQITWPKQDREIVRFDLQQKVGAGGTNQTGTHTDPLTSGGKTTGNPLDDGNETQHNHGKDTGKGEENFDWLSKRAVTDADLQGKSKDDLRIMRNWIFARHGRSFQSRDLQEYFKHFKWYKPGQETPPSDLEAKNAVKLKEREDQLR